MARERRMIARAISTSRKVAKLSDQEALIFTWLIPWTDDECRMEADPEIIKARIFPLRPEITQEIIHESLIKFHKIGLGIYYQTIPKDIHGIKKIPSILPSYDPINIPTGSAPLHQTWCTTGVVSYFEFSNKNAQTFHGIKKIPSILPSYDPLHHIWCIAKPERMSKLNKIKLKKIKLDDMNNIQPNS